MRLLVAWEWGHWWLGNETTGGLGMRPLVAWEWGYWWPGNEVPVGLGMRLLVVSAWEWDRGLVMIGFPPHPPQTDKKIPVMVTHPAPWYRPWWSLTQPPAMIITHPAPCHDGHSPSPLPWWSLTQPPGIGLNCHAAVLLFQVFMAQQYPCREVLLVQSHSSPEVRHCSVVFPTKTIEITCKQAKSLWYYYRNNQLDRKKSFFFFFFFFFFGALVDFYYSMKYFHPPTHPQNTHTHTPSTEQVSERYLSILTTSCANPLSSERRSWQ